MKRYIRIIAALLCVIMLLSFVGCRRIEPIAEDDSQPVSLTTEPPDATPGPQPAPTATQDPLAGEHFAALDLEVFCWYATVDGSTYHSLVTDPAAFGIDPAGVEMTLGDFSEEASDVYAKEAADYLLRLKEIPRAALSQTEQFSYDVMQRYLEIESDDTDYDYFYEPLTEYSGIHANLPLMFGLFHIESQQDVEDYLTLFADTPRYFGQVLAYEQERAKRGLFMTQNALEAILDGCQDIIDSKDNSFLYVLFADAVDGIAELTDQQKKDYIARNESLIKNEYIGAYQTLYDGLRELKKDCRDEEGLYAVDKRGKAYFERAMQLEADNELSVDETVELLKDEMTFIYMESDDIMQRNPSIFDQTGDIGSGNTETDLEQVKKIAYRILPELPEHTLLIESVPEELEDLMPPACYEIPSLDGWQQNKVLINPANHDASALLTLAHEAYPGHLYQYVYQRGNDQLGVTQRALHYGGYAEGWSQLAEYLVLSNQNTYDKDYATLTFYNNMLTNALLPALVSILVNYYGYDKNGIQTFLSSLGLTDSLYGDHYFALAVEQPFYTIRYAVGYSQLMKMVRDAQADLGESYDQQGFLTAFLDLGPGYFNLIQERMDVWLDNKMMEEDI